MAANGLRLTLATMSTDTISTERLMATGVREEGEGYANGVPKRATNGRLR
jgi:hypothetical protein